MNRSRTKMLIAGTVVLAGVGFLAFAGAKEGWVYYMPVDDFIAAQDVQHRRVRLHGTVASENLEFSPAMLSARFDLRGEASSVRVDYSGVIPDLFQADRDVVVEGRLNDETGVFEADVLLTKCASKYEAKGAPHAAGEESGS